MGKISEALKKVAMERERQKFKQEPLPKIDKQKQPQIDTPVSVVGETKKLSLEEKLRLKEKLYIARAKDNSGIDPRIVAYYDRSSPASEQYRMLRTNIKSCLRRVRNLHKISNVRPAGAPYIFAVTSSLHSEGKTVTAANLAVTLASDLGSRVLLVDCDLRNGLIHKLLNINCEPGLSDILTKDFEWPVSLHPTILKNLFVIPRGKAPSNPSELLGSRKMHLVIEKLKSENFTHVILDTPPLLPFTDGAILGARTEGVLLIVQANRSSAQIVRKAKEFLEQTHNKIMGFILTHTDYYTPDFYGYYHYYYKNNQ